MSMDKSERMRTALNTIARRLAPSTRTFDQMMRDMTLSCDIARAALAPEQDVDAAVDDMIERFPKALKKLGE